MRSTKALILICLFAVILSSLFSCGMFEDNTVYAVIETGREENGFIYDVYENNTATLTGCTLTDATITVPDTLGGYPVTTIGEKAFDSNENILYVKLGKNVTAIAQRAFSSAKNLPSPCEIGTL